MVGIEWDPLEAEDFLMFSGGPKESIGKKWINLSSSFVT